MTEAAGVRIGQTVLTLISRIDGGPGRPRSRVGRSIGLSYRGVVGTCIRCCMVRGVRRESQAEVFRADRERRIAQGECRASLTGRPCGRIGGRSGQTSSDGGRLIPRALRVRPESLCGVRAWRIPPVVHRRDGGSTVVSGCPPIRLPDVPGACSCDHGGTP